MERSGKRVQKNRDENRDGDASSSASSGMSQSSQGHKTNEATENKNSNKNEGRNTSKKIKINRGESQNSSGQFEAEPDQATRIEDAPIDNLPPEMLTEIFKFVDTRSLLKCRLVSRQWRGISTAIFRNRVPANPICFHWEGDTFRQKDGRSLKRFLHCAKQSPPENCPFTQFWFSTDDSTWFEDKDFRDFLSLFSTRRLKHVKLEASYHPQEFPVFVEKLRHFLLNDVPQLEGLHLEFYSLSQDEVDYTQVPLFLINTNTNANSDGPPLPVQFELPNLKLLHLETWTISAHPQIYKDLLNAAVNLIRIKMTLDSPEYFEFFHSLGKIHLLKELVLCFNGNFVEEIKKDEFQLQFKKWSLPENSFPQVQLEKLELMDNIDVSKFDEASSIQASKLVSALLESSKDSLKELEMEEFGFLAHLQLPVFTRLRTLKINGKETYQIFPSETRTRNIFPAMDSLELKVCNWTVAFPQTNSIPRLPGVKTLILKECIFKVDHADTVLIILSQLCPNLKKLVVQKAEEDLGSRKLNLIQFGRSIWTHMKDLESLEVEVDLNNPEYISAALDSCFSGISTGNCSRLRRLREAKQLLEANGVPVEIPESKLKAEREYPSILDMKNLRNLTINPYAGGIFLEKKFFTNYLTWVSRELAFKLMPNLKFNEESF